MNITIIHIGQPDPSRSITEISADEKSLQSVIESVLNEIKIVQIRDSRDYEIAENSLKKIANTQKFVTDFFKPEQERRAAAYQEINNKSYNFV